MSIPQSPSLRTAQWIIGQLSFVFWGTSIKIFIVVIPDYISTSNNSLSPSTSSQNFSSWLSHSKMGTIAWLLRLSYFFKHLPTTYIFFLLRTLWSVQSPIYWLDGLGGHLEWLMLWLGSGRVSQMCWGREVRTALRSEQVIYLSEV